MPRPLLFLFLVFCSNAVAALPCYSQAAAKAPAPESASVAAERGIDLAAKGQCAEALPILRRTTGRLTDKQVKYRAGMATAKCAMSLGQEEAAVQALLMLKREFPHDPQALYISAHYFSELGNGAAQELAAAAPESYQAHELEAEAFESQGRWAEAAGEYQKILDHDANVPGIHFRLGRVALSRGESEANTAEAKKEFEQELKIDPSNAAAEFSLGEIARRAGQWDEAIGHFSTAAKIDSGFAEAFLAMGMSLVSAQRFAEAVPPLQKYVKMVPTDPAGHYQLAISYDRTGRKEEAARELQLQRETAAKAPASGANPH
ncbi:MAG TPA: tetratricopeptide repeat protein [Candidatus Angelobacter sp.]|nr:tetratricopeptide repeat protein [Candidatus Angelobacter sp.]